MKHIPIILILASTQTLEVRARESGANGYLSKPFETKELLGKLGELLALLGN